MGFSKKIFPHLNKCSCLDNVKYFLERVFSFIFKVLFLKISTLMVGGGLIKTKSFSCFLLLFQICSVLVIPHQENRESGGSHISLLLRFKNSLRPLSLIPSRLSPPQSHEPFCHGLRHEHLFLFWLFLSKFTSSNFCMVYSLPPCGLFSASTFFLRVPRIIFHRTCAPPSAFSSLFHFVGLVFSNIP